MLSGAISNAGDYLIKHSAVRLLKRLRPDRALVLRDRRQPLDPHDAQVADAAAILLCGGPAWQPDVYPRIYPLAADLSQLRAPIAPLALGWRAPAGAREEDFSFIDPARPLIERIAADGLIGTCRDDTTLRLLQRAGLTNQRMGGCTSWFHFPSFGRPMTPYSTVERVAVSIGALPMDDPSFADQTERVLAVLSTRYSAAEHIAVFHHPLAGASNLAPRRAQAQRRLASRVAAMGWSVTDVGGEARSMMDLYEQVDLHIGFRVHAHLFRCALRRPSVLIAEDTRAHDATASLGHTALSGVVVREDGQIGPAQDLQTQLVTRLDAEERSGWAGLRTVPDHIERAFRETVSAVAALP